MNWEQACNDPSLQDLPYRIELNEWGNIEMSPVSIRHLRYQKKILSLLEHFLEHGEAFMEFPVETSKNVKVPDVVWIAQERWEQVKEAVASPVAPEICVEVLSPGNTSEEMRQKRGLYFEKGAQEVWICDQNGNMRFYTSQEELSQSQLVPEFPLHIEL